MARVAVNRTLHWVNARSDSFAWLGKSRSPYATEFRWGKGLITIFLCSVLIVLGIRGSFGKFPLRLQDWAVTTDGFLNNAVPNGVASFWEAIKEQRMLTLKGGVNEGVKNLGFDNLAEAQDVLKRAGQKSAFNGDDARSRICGFLLDGIDGTR